MPFVPANLTITSFNMLFLSLHKLKLSNKKQELSKTNHWRRSISKSDRSLNEIELRPSHFRKNRSKKGKLSTTTLIYTIAFQMVAKLARVLP